jgi:hypothetical protein
LLYATRRRLFGKRLHDWALSPETVFFDRMWRLINLLGWMFRARTRNIHPIVVILASVSDAEVADPDARGCSPANTRVDKRRTRITRRDTPLEDAANSMINAAGEGGGRGRA